MGNRRGRVFKNYHHFASPFDSTSYYRAWQHELKYSFLTLCFYALTLTKIVIKPYQSTLIEISFRNMFTLILCFPGGFISTVNVRFMVGDRYTFGFFGTWKECICETGSVCKPSVKIENMK